MTSQEVLTLARQMHFPTMSIDGRTLRGTLAWVQYVRLASSRGRARLYAELVARARAKG